MSTLDPGNTTLRDICTEALRQCGAFGVGTTPLAEDITAAWARLQWMLQQWERKRWLVYHLKSYVITSTGALFYTVGPGGDFDTGPNTTRPEKIERGFLRQLTQSQPNQIDYPLDLLQSMEDYTNISLKQLNSFPNTVFYDPAWPLGKAYFWPVPQSAIYGPGLVIRAQLPVKFSNLNAVFDLPYEYYNAMLLNLAVNLRGRYQIPTFPGDPLVALAKDSLNVLRPANAAIARLGMPKDLNRSGIYNIFSDRMY